jgi:hypothetical protein
MYVLIFTGGRLADLQSISACALTTAGAIAQHIPIRKIHVRIGFDPGGEKS